MFAVIYQFEVKENMTTQFIATWEELTQLIFEHEGSLGSRLHKENDTLFIAYAQWPDRETWKNSGNKLPDYTNDIRTQMKEACGKIETLHQLECINDLLK